jgi:hypothetical protein
MDDNILSTPHIASAIEVQREVQRKLGRCMIRIQQFELLMKAMLSSMAAEGTVEQLELALKKTAADVNGKSLGNLLTDYFFAGYLVNADSVREKLDPAEEVEPSSPEAAAVDAGRPYFKYRFQIQMEPHELEREKAALIKFRNLRNDIVHHLLDKFNLGEALSCQAALAYLDESYEAIDEHFIRLKGWASSMNTTREASIAFMQSNAYLDFLVNGINPDGTVDWPASGVVKALRAAEAACATNGWTLLDSAIAWLRTDHADQTPAKYQCKTWKQVLERSKQFEIRAATDSVSNRGQTWFRSNELV